jgi:hypothetical protein
MASELGGWHHAYLRFRRGMLGGVCDKIMADVVAQGEPKLAFAASCSNRHQPDVTLETRLSYYPGLEYFKKGRQWLTWFKFGDFWVTRTRRNGRVLKPDVDRLVVACGRPVGLPGSRLLGLKRAEAQQRQPVRMAFVGQQFPRAVSGSLSALAAYETTVVQEES